MRGGFFRYRGAKKAERCFVSEYRRSQDGASAVLTPSGKTAAKTCRERAKLCKGLVLPGTKKAGKPEACPPVSGKRAVWE